MILYAITVAGASMGSDVPRTMVEHFDFIWVLLVAAIFIIVFFAVKTFNRFDLNQIELFNRMRETENSLQFLKGEHESMCTNVIPVLTELANSIRLLTKLGGEKK